VLLAAPHRLLFLAGVAQAILVMSFWLVHVGARHAGLWTPNAWPMPAPWLHALMLSYGVFPFFIFGFILTAGPRWQGAPETPSRVFVPASVLMAGGWLLADAGLLLPMLLPVGLAIALVGWLIAVRFLWQVASADDGERRHIVLVAAALSAGALGLAAFAVAAAAGVPVFAVSAITLGLWGMLLPVFLVVTHRMLPFFSSGMIRGYVVRQPFWALATLLAASALHGALAFGGSAQWTWLVDLPAFATATYLTLAWRLRDSFVATILAVLHVGFAWVSIAFALFAWHSLSLLLGSGGLGLAPLHALTLGYFSSVAIGMGSRVTLGHSGRPVAGDVAMATAFVALQLAACLRIAGEFFILPGMFNLSFLAALAWLGAFGLWSATYAPRLWRPRADGRPG
jgi:uncharacterized protein involved in response to NO